MNSSKLNICIIGLGNIGFYHLYSIVKYAKNIKILVIDRKKKNFIKIIQFFGNKHFNVKKISLNFRYNLDFSDEIFDFLLISTTSDNRYSIIQKVLKKNKVKNILVEKISAANFKEYKNILNLLKIKKITNHINFSRREYEVYNYIYKKLRKLRSQKINLKFIGFNWNLASNIFHFVDLFAYLNSDNKMYIRRNELDKKVYKSPRKNFHELKGRISFYNNKGSTIVCEDDKRNSIKNKSNLLTIDHKMIKFVINEKKNLLIEHNKKNGTINKKKFIMPYQSDLTYKTMSKILRRKANLPSYLKSLKMHKMLLTALISHISKYSNKKNVIPRIT